MVEKKMPKRKAAGMIVLWITICLWLSGATVFAQCQIQDDARLFTTEETKKIENLSEEIQDQYQMNDAGHDLRRCRRKRIPRSFGKIPMRNTDWRVMRPKVESHC